MIWFKTNIFLTWCSDLILQVTKNFENDCSINHLLIISIEKSFYFALRTW
jgi:hypothetical protein